MNTEELNKEFLVHGYFNDVGPGYASVFTKGTDWKNESNHFAIPRLPGTRCWDVENKIPLRQFLDSL